MQADSFLVNAIGVVYRRRFSKGLRAMSKARTGNRTLRLREFPLRVLLVTALAVTAQAADSDVSVELNKLEQMDGACRAYFVLENGSGIAFDSLKLDLVMFDTDRIVSRRLAAEVGPLSPGKTSLKVFDMEDLLCAELGRLLLNDVTTCADDSGSRDNCLVLLSTSTRATVPFIK